jgi:hypothetical protein
MHAVTRLRPLLLILLLLAWNGPALRSAEPGVSVSVKTTPFPLTIGLGVETPNARFSSYRDGGTTVFTNDDFRIQISETASQPRSIIRVRVDRLSAEAFRLNHFYVRVRVPRDQLTGIWFPGSDANSTTMMAATGRHPFLAIADANFGIPYVGAVSSTGKTTFAFGMGKQDLSVVMKGEPVGNGLYEMELRITTVRTATSFDERIYLSNDTTSMWFETAANYTDWVDAYTNYKQFPISRKAYEPLYDTWYWSGDRVDQNLYLKTAELASAVGAGLYLADSGWDAPEGEYDQWLAGRTGDYNPPRDKFPNLAETFATIRSKYGMGVQLWLQPFAVGRESVRYAPTRNLHIQIPVDFNSVIAWSGVTLNPVTLPLGEHLETVNLCPRMPGTVTYLRNLFTEMGNKYNPDGYWLDFIDGIATFCVSPHQHTYPSFGDGFRRSLDAVKTAILARNPNAVVHFRARYANLNTKPYANVWQSEDSPGDYDRMRLNALRLRPFSKGVVFGTDELFWPLGLPDSKIAKFIMTSVMTGVPAFGANLLYSPESERTMLTAWLRFYRNHMADLTQGKFIPYGSIWVPNHKIEAGDRTYVYVRQTNADVVAEGKTIYIMNATDSSTFNMRIRAPLDISSFNATIFDRFHAAQGQIRLAVNGDGMIAFRGSVEEGGMVVLTPWSASDGGPEKNIGRSYLNLPMSYQK